MTNSDQLGDSISKKNCQDLNFWKAEGKQIVIRRKDPHHRQNLQHSQNPVKLKIPLFPSTQDRTADKILTNEKPEQIAEPDMN